jgi:ABC-type transport system involved in cytochrome c biogenesis permease subunit
MDMIPVNADAEIFVTSVAMLIYLVGSAALLVVYENSNDKKKDRWYIALKSLAILVHSIAILMRWVRVDHGPFINLYEILSSNIWSLSIITLLVYARIPSIRRTFHFCELIIVILVVWFMSVDPVESHLPPTYNTIWLYFHVVSGKLFFGLLLVSTSLAIASDLRYLGVVSSSPDILYLNELAYRFLAIAFLFESMMLLIGAIWAQDAWGRYWAWDPLETWALITWLTVIFILHVRAWINPKLANWLIPIAFVLAFLTFFGIPFYSTAPHKGMI